MAKKLTVKQLQQLLANMPKPTQSLNAVDNTGRQMPRPEENPASKEAYNMFLNQLQKKAADKNAYINDAGPAPVYKNVGEKVRADLERESRQRDLEASIPNEKFNSWAENVAMPVADAAMIAEGGSSIPKLLEMMGSKISPEAIAAIAKNPKVAQQSLVKELPGLHLKSTMTGSPLEKQISKTGDISIESIKNYLKKEDVSAADKDVINNLLNTKYSSKNSVNYNDFRKDVQKKLVPLKINDVKDFEYDKVGLDRLGYPNKTTKSLNEYIEWANKSLYDNSKRKQMWEKALTEPGMSDNMRNIAKRNLEQINETDAFVTKQLNDANETLKINPNTNTFTFRNKKQFGAGSNKHFSNKSTLGHTREMVTKEEPKIKHILESQSDYNQSSEELDKLKKYLGKSEKTESDLETMSDLQRLAASGEETPVNVKPYVKKIENELWNIKNGYFQQKKHLFKSHPERFLQENIKKSAKEGFEKMRYPTKETTIKIQGYDTPSEATTFTPEQLQAQETILRRAEETPKLVKKLFGKEAKIVTDSKGNTWYEFDIPDNYKKGKAEIKALSTAALTALGANKLKNKNK
jgi:hypothetical protein